MKFEYCKHTLFPHHAAELQYDLNKNIEFLENHVVPINYTIIKLRTEKTFLFKEFTYFNRKYFQ